MSARHFRLENALVLWHERWLVQGALVMCRGCQASQFAGDAGTQFRHGEQCTQARGRQQLPWHELANRLRTLPGTLR